MSRFRTITYMIDTNEGLVYSRVGNEIAIPVLQWPPKCLKNLQYKLEKFNIFEVAIDIKDCIHTRKISLKIKNKHRRFWGLKPIKS